MKFWRTWIVTLLVLALPLTSIANTFNSHCEDTKDATTEHVAPQSDDHCATDDPLNGVKDSSQPTECGCDCSDSLGCLTTSANVFTATTVNHSITFRHHTSNTAEPIDQYISFQPPPLIRPPIFLS